MSSDEADSPETETVEPTDRRAKRAVARRHIDRSVRLKVRTFGLIFLVATVVAVIEVVMSERQPWWQALLGLVAGVLVGVIVSRIQRLGWDHFERKVVGTMDVVGVIILVLYLPLMLGRSRLVGLWVPPGIVAPVSMAVLAGVMVGQVLGIRRGLLRLATTLRPHGVDQKSEAPT